MGLYDLERRPISAVVDGTGAGHAKAHIARLGGGTKRRARSEDDAIDDPPERGSVAETVSDASPVSDGVAFGGKSDRLAVAKQALSSAERHKRWREKDPEAYRKWNRERMKARRAKIRGSPSE